MGSGYLKDIKGRIFIMKFLIYLGSISFLIYKKKIVGIKFKSIFVMGSFFDYAGIYDILDIMFLKISYL